MNNLKDEVSIGEQTSPLGKYPCEVVIQVDLDCALATHRLIRLIGTEGFRNWFHKEIPEQIERTEKRIAQEKEGKP